jgi:hypothetical protein
MDERNLCLKKIIEYTRHEAARLTNSGDGAIFAALHIAKQEGYNQLLIPDQGGWLSYKTFPELLSIKTMEIKTDRGLIDPGSLILHKHMAVIVPSYAGYIAEQPLEKISEACRERGHLLIEDASGAIGSERLCNGRFSDIIVGSFGKAKIVDNEHGGFISGRKEMLMHKETNPLTEPVKLDHAALLGKLDKAMERLAMLLTRQKKVKEDLKSFEIIHRDAQGINAAILFRSEEEKTKIIKYCSENGLEYTICPRYIRVLEDAISIEIKRQKT